MQRIDTATKFANLFGAGKHGFRDGNKAAGIAPTAFNAAWVNSVQEEIAAVVEAAGSGLDAANNGQLLAALKSGGLFDTQAASDSSRKVATTAFVKNLLASLPGDKYLQGLSSYNASTNVMKLAMSDGSTVDVDMTQLVNDAVSSIAVVTASDDASFVNNSSSPASTSWVRGAMLAIAQSAGFDFSYATNGSFIRFPNWLGRYIIQSGIFTTSPTGYSSLTFPVAFGNSLLGFSGVINGSGFALNGVAVNMPLKTLTSVPVAAPTGGGYSSVSISYICVGY